MYPRKIPAGSVEKRLDVILRAWVSFVSEYFLCIIHIDKKPTHVSKLIYKYVIFKYTII